MRLPTHRTIRDEWGTRPVNYVLQSIIMPILSFDFNVQSFHALDEH